MDVQKRVKCNREPDVNCSQALAMKLRDYGEQRSHIDRYEYWHKLPGETASWYNIWLSLIITHNVCLLEILQRVASRDAPRRRPIQTQAAHLPTASSAALYR